MTYVNLECKTRNSTDDGKELKQDGCFVDIILLNILLFTLESDTTCSLFQLLSIISGAPRAREVRAERSTMGKKIW